MRKHLQLILLALLSLLFVFQSCNDEELPKIPEPVKTLLSKVYSDSSETVYTYDDDSLLLSTRRNTIRPGDIGGTSNWEYNENNQLIKRTDVADDNSNKFVDEFFYKERNIDSIKTYAFYNGSTDTAYVSTYKYEYSGNELYKVQEYRKDSEAVFEPSSYYYILEWDNNGNLIKEYRYDKNDELEYVANYEYDNHNNPYQNTPKGKYRWVSSRKNNVTKLEFVFSAGNTQLYTSSTFKYNDLDYPVEEERYYANEDVTITYYYEYE